MGFERGRWGELFNLREMYIYIYTIADCRCREIIQRVWKLYALLVRGPTALVLLDITKYDELLSECVTGCTLSKILGAPERISISSLSGHESKVSCNIFMALERNRTSAWWKIHWLLRSCYIPLSAIFDSVPCNIAETPPLLFLLISDASAVL